MNKKIIIISLIICLVSILLCCNIYASNLKSDIKSSGNKAGTALRDAENHIANGVKDTANGIKNVGSSMMSGAMSTGNNMKSKMDTSSNNGYIAEKTSANSNNVLGMSTTAWIWMIFAVVTIAIVALVWYYGSQYEHRNYDNN